MNDITLEIEWMNCLTLVINEWQNPLMNVSVECWWHNHTINCTVYTAHNISTPQAKVELKFSFEFLHKE